MKEYKARKSGLYRWIVPALVLIPVLCATVWSAGDDSAQTLGESGDVPPGTENVEQDPAGDPEAGIMPLADNNGTCGDNLTWILSDDGTLTISGTGDMWYYSSTNFPWYDSKNDIKTVIIKDGVTHIGTYAFSGCSGLTSITIPNGVTSIDRYAFSDCKGLTNLTIPDGVTYIGIYAFTGCKGLTSLTIPNSVTSIGTGVFNGCSGLTSITIPNGVTSIGDGVFNGCNKLTDVYYSGTKSKWDVISIGTGNDSLSSATIHYSTVASGKCGDNLTWGLDSSGNLTISGTGNMWDYTNLCGPWGKDIKTVSIGSDVTSIGEYAFLSCDKLTDITIPEKVTSIGYAAFSGCSSLTDVTIPAGVTSIVTRAFDRCGSLTKVTFLGDITDIGYTAFNECVNLTDIAIPDSVTSIGMAAFSGCTKLTDIRIPAKVTKLDAETFQNCTSLQKVEILGNITIIGSKAFSGCRSLENITIPESVRSIDADAFSGCEKLTAVSLPTGITFIGSRTFNACSGLMSVTIPKSVKEVGFDAFNKCGSLADVYYSGTKSQWEAITINSGNDPLTSAELHCEPDPPVPDDPEPDPPTPDDPEPDPPTPDDPDPDLPVPDDPDPEPPVHSDDVLLINRSLQVSNGKRLNLLADIPIRVLDGAVFLISGILNVGDTWINESTVEISGTVTAEKGIQNNGGIVSMTGGALTSGASDGTIHGGGTLRLTGGTITNTGSGPALLLDTAPSDWDITATLRSRSPSPVQVNGTSYIPDGYEVIRQDGYYTLVRK